MNLKQVHQFSLQSGYQIVYENEIEAPGFSLQIYYPFLYSITNVNPTVRRYHYGVEINEFPWENMKSETIFNKKLSIGDNFIIRELNTLYDMDPMKVVVRELTDKTILFLNHDSGYEIRKTLDEFYSDFEILEVIETAKQPEWKQTVSNRGITAAATSGYSQVKQ